MFTCGGNLIITELHRHLDASLRLSTLHELGQQKGLLPRSTSLESFELEFILREPLKDLGSVLEKFKLFQLVLDRPEWLERVAFEAVEDCRAEGTRQVEFRFSPSFVCEHHSFDWAEALSSFRRGILRAQKKFPEMCVGLLCIATRDYGPESVAETVEFFLKHREELVGLDLAGGERGFPCRIFEKEFKKAIQAGAKITIHAGEDCGPENVWEALECLGASRIGHGIRSVEDPKLMQRLAKDQICLEVCPTSNWITQAVKDLKAHPLKDFLRAGVPACINTDDPGIFGVSLPYEKNLCQNLLGLSLEEIALCNSSAERSTFIPVV